MFTSRGGPGVWGWASRAGLGAVGGPAESLKENGELLQNLNILLVKQLKKKYLKEAEVGGASSAFFDLAVTEGGGGLSLDRLSSS
jgi:hypothetical protein